MAVSSLCNGYFLIAITVMGSQEKYRSCKINETTDCMYCTGMVPHEIPSDITSVELRKVVFDTKSNMPPILRWLNVGTLRHTENEFKGLLPNIRLTTRRVHHLIYSNCNFNNNLFYGDMQMGAATSVRFEFYNTLSPCVVEIRDSKIGNGFSKARSYFSFYNATKLFLRNITCFSSQVTFRLSSIATQSLHVFLVSCPIKFQFGSYFPSAFSSQYTFEERLLSHDVPYEMNFTGSESIALDFLHRSSPFTCNLHKYTHLVSLDVSKIVLSQYKTPILKVKQTCLPAFPALKKFYALNVIHSSCNLYVQMYNITACLQVNYTKCCGQFYIICVEPKTVELLNLAENHIAVVESSIMEAFSSLKSLDVSKNLLYAMNGAAYLNFGKLTVLEDFFCSSNKLTAVPVDMFDRMSNLKMIDLSENNLEKIPFSIHHLRNLTLLNLRSNGIEVLEPSLFSELSNLVTYQMLNANETIQLDLSENPLVCDCPVKPSLVWLLDNRPLLMHLPLYCTLDGKSYIIDDRILQTIDNICRTPLYIGLSCLLVAITSAIIIISSVYCYRRRLNLQNQRHIRYVIEHFKQDVNADWYPVFLSFCSLNTDFVMENIYIELNRRLQGFLGTTKRCVAFGDGNFRPGLLVVEEMVRCVSVCDVALVCVSNDYLRSSWCADEIRIAKYFKKNIILIFLEDVDKKLLNRSIIMEFFASSCRAKLIHTGDMVELQPDWCVICEVILSHMSMPNTDLEVDTSV